MVYSSVNECLAGILALGLVFVLWFFVLPAGKVRVDSLTSFDWIFPVLLFDCLFDSQTSDL
jgi:hypothetical protein